MAGIRHSCWALLNLFIVSTNKTVRCPNFLACLASSKISCTSKFAPFAEDKATNLQEALRAINLARDVFPVQGGPPKMMQGKISPSSKEQRTQCGPSRWSWPSNSVVELGRIRSAKDATVLPASWACYLNPTAMGEDVAGATGKGFSASPSSCRLLFRWPNNHLPQLFSL